MEMRFHIPSTDGEGDPVEQFHQKVLAHADVIQATGDSIAVFPEVQILTPRYKVHARAHTHQLACILCVLAYDMSVILSVCVCVCMCRVVYVLCIHECLGVCYHGMA